jgi:hypothetical protein
MLKMGFKMKVFLEPDISNAKRIKQMLIKQSYQVKKKIK